LQFAQTLKRSDLSSKLLAAGAKPELAPDARLAVAARPDPWRAAAAWPMPPARRWALRVMGPRRAWARLNGVGGSFRPRPLAAHRES
jgi:hypothetical protein